MNKCINPEVGKLLHAYELAVLNESDTDRFETHLLKCDYCFNEASSFSDDISMLLRDPEIKNTVDDYARLPGQPDSVWTGIRYRLWPPGISWFLRPAFIYALILILITPAYLGVKSYIGSRARPIQSIGLYQSRSPELGILEKNKGSDAVVSFLVDDFSPGDSLHIIIRGAGGNIVYESEHFTNVDKSGIGRLYLALDKFSKGEYSIEVINPRAGQAFGNREYNFAIR